jgi:hypothetical protein
MQDWLVSASAASWQWQEKNGLITAGALRPAAPSPGICTRTALPAALSCRRLAFLRHNNAIRVPAAALLRNGFSIGYRRLRVLGSLPNFEKIELEDLLVLTVQPEVRHQHHRAVSAV